MHSKLDILLAESFLIPFLAIFVFTLYAFIVFRINIHGDAKYHALSAKESAEKGYLVDHQPYRIFSFENNERKYMPIAYPLTAESLFTLFYIDGGENALKLYAPLLAAFIFIFSYLCIKEIGVWQAGTIAAIASLAIGERLIMTPLMEPFMIVMLLSGIFLLKKYFYTYNSYILYLAGFFFGVAAAVKQQGILLSAFLLFFVGSVFLFDLFKKQRTFFASIKIFFTFLIVCLLVPSVAFANQVYRTGTLAYAPGGTGLNSSFPLAKYVQPLITSKFTSDPAALQSIQDTIGYNKQKISLLGKLKGFVVSPFLYYRSTDGSFVDEAYEFLTQIIIIAILLGFFFLLKHLEINRIWLLLYGLLGTEVSSSFLFRTPITQYHSFGVLIATMLIFILPTKTLLAGKYVKVLCLLVFSYFFIKGYFIYILPLWDKSGREENYQIEGYKKIGNFVKGNTGTSAVFLAAETSFRYYSQRDIVWLNENIGDEIREIITTSDEKTALETLKKLHAEYIVINRDQTERRGVNDYLPPEGLVSMIDTSRYFTKVYDVNNDNRLIVYKINYLSGDSIN